MNPTPHYVKEVLGRPYREYGLWWLRVKAGAHGQVSESVIVFTTREAALAVGFGYCFTVDAGAALSTTPNADGGSRPTQMPNYKAGGSPSKAGR